MTQKRSSWPGAVKQLRNICCRLRLNNSPPSQYDTRFVLGDQISDCIVSDALQYSTLPYGCVAKKFFNTLKKDSSYPSICIRWLKFFFKKSHTVQCTCTTAFWFWHLTAGWTVWQPHQAPGTVIITCKPGWHTNLYQLSGALSFRCASISWIGYEGNRSIIFFREIFSSGLQFNQITGQTDNWQPDNRTTIKQTNKKHL